MSTDDLTVIKASVADKVEQVKNLLVVNQSVE